MSPTASQTEIEMESRPGIETSRQEEELSQLDRSEGHLRTGAQQLEPADGGASAWKLLCAAFVFEALLWGMEKERTSPLPFLIYIYIYVPMS